MFRFRRFSVDDGRSAMKVGTDGVLLGAWALEGAPAPPLVVDVGCGCGLIALMLAQRLPGVPIEAVDIDGPSLEDARANVAASPFAGRIALREGDFLSLPPFPEGTAFVCNPPFYTEDTLPPDVRRAAARNSRALPLEDLVGRASCGTLSLVLPAALEGELLASAHAAGLHLRRLCRVRTTERKAPKRILAELAAEAAEPQFSELVLTAPCGARSEAYAALCRDFYL
ncbi:MAG: methyltransferase [Bacteroidaceae bacterium]|nr:methyltransferase [Bacteroidaceae bacterium]MBR7051544.1 methyltransferase [Bacteroidaceae bacterium]